MKESTRVLVALGIAVVAGSLIGLTGNSSLLRAADSIAPVGTLWVNAIRMTVIPLVVSLLITGVSSVSDVSSVGRLGGRSLLTFVLLSSLVALIFIPLAPLLFTLLPSGVGAHALPEGASEAAGLVASAGTVQTFSSWLTSLVPTNPIAAAASGAILPLIVFTVLFALAISQSSEATRYTLVAFFRAVSEAMLTLVRWVVLLAPIGVFALVLPLATHVGASLAGAIGFYILAYSLSCIAVVLVAYVIVALFGGVSVSRFARAIFPAQLIAFSSSSSIASLPALVESAEVLELPASVTGFVLPLAVSTFKFAAPVSWTVGALFVAWFYGVPMHARELGIIGFAAVFLGFGVPGIPRGAFVMLAPLYAAIGLPVEGLGILIAVDVIPDTFATALNVTGDLVAATIVAKSEARHSKPQLLQQTP